MIAFQPSNRRWSSGPLSCQLSRLFWGERVEDVDGGQVSAVTAPSIRAHTDVLLPHLQLCSGRFCRGTASIVNVVWCFSASAESLVTQSIGATIRTESGVQPICNALVSSPSAAVAATEVAAPVVRVLLGVRRLQFQLRLLIRRLVSKSHRLQFRERLQCKSRVPICLVVTLVSLATAASSLSRWLCSGVQHNSYLQQHDCARWCHHLCFLLVGFEATTFLSATGVGIFDRGRERHVRQQSVSFSTSGAKAHALWSSSPTASCSSDGSQTLSNFGPIPYGSFSSPSNASCKTAR